MKKMIKFWSWNCPWKIEKNFSWCLIIMMSGGDDDLDHLSTLSKLRIAHRISICRAHMIDLQGLAYKLWTLGSFLVESLPERKQQQAAALSSHSFKADAWAAAADHDGFQIYSFSTKQNAVSLSNVTRPDTIFLRSKQLCISLHFQRYVTLLKVCHINRYCCNFKFTNTIINDILLVVLFCLGYVICKKTRLLIVYWSMNGLIQLADPTNQWSVVVCCRWLMCCSPCCPS